MRGKHPEILPGKSNTACRLAVLGLCIERFGVVNPRRKMRVVSVVSVVSVVKTRDESVPVSCSMVPKPKEWEQLDQRLQAQECTLPREAP